MELFTVGGVKPKKSSSDRPSESAQELLEQVRVVLVTGTEERRRFQKLLRKHHYLGGLRAVGEQMYYAAVDAQGHWLALLLFSAAAKHLKHRDQWIGWTRAQRDRRLSLVVNNSRFLILPHAHMANLGSRVLRLTLDRLSADWQARYGHPVLVVETFVDPEQFNGTVYTANGWQEVGLTDGWGRCRRDFYVQHDKPKRLFVREVVKNARRSLQAEHLKPALAGVEKKAGARCYHKCGELRALTEHFKALPEYRGRVESYPVWSLVTLMLLAHAVRCSTRAEGSGQAGPPADPTPTPRSGHSAQSQRPFSSPQSVDVSLGCCRGWMPGGSTRSCWTSRPKCVASPRPMN